MSDYIKRDAFLAEERKRYCEDCDRRKGMKRGKMRMVYEIGDAPCRACRIGDVLDDVDDYPAANVVKRKSGEWLETWHKFFKRELPVCSYCGSFTVYRTNYCPNCGADMRGQDAE